MNIFKTIGSLFEKASGRTVVGTDKKGNQFYTLPPPKPDLPLKRMVDYKGYPEPAELHPLWKHWLARVRDEAPTEKDIYAWEMEQARLRRRLREIDAASSKMQSEAKAERERGESGMQSAIAELMSKLSSDSENQTYQRPETRPPAAAPLAKRPIHAEAANSANGPKPGENIVYQNGVKVVPKEHKAYSPDPSRLAAILSQATPTAADRSRAAQSSSDAPTSSWNPADAQKSRNDDDL